MNIVRKINLILVTLLALAAGIPKVMRIPEEVSFFQNAGLGEDVVVVFGLMQLAGGVLLVLRKTRVWGAIAAAFTFLISAVMLFMAGQIAFALVSVLPVLMAGVVLEESVKKEPHASG